MVLFECKFDQTIQTLSRQGAFQEIFYSLQPITLRVDWFQLIFTPVLQRELHKQNWWLEWKPGLNKLEFESEKMSVK